VCSLFVAIPSIEEKTCTCVAMTFAHGEVTDRVVLDRGEECPICCREFKNNAVITKLVCGHLLCNRCSAKVMKRCENPVCALCRAEADMMTHVKVATCHVIEDDEQTGGIQSRNGLSVVTCLLMVIHLSIVLVSIAWLWRTVAVNFQTFEQAGQLVMRDIIGVTHTKTVDIFDVVEKMIEDEEFN